MYAALTVYLTLSPFGDEWLIVLHIGFFLLSAAACGILVYSNKNRPLFFIIVTVLGYCLINFLKYYHGTIYNLTSDYYNLIFFMAVFLLFFYFLPNRPFFSMDTVRFLAVIFIGMAIGEHLSRLHVGLDFSRLLCNGCGLQIFGLSLFLSILIIMLIHSSIKDDILNSALFFACINIMIGLYLSDRPTPLALFFFSAMLTVFCAVIYSHYYNTYKDPVTGFYNINSFAKHASQFSPKYGLGIICIDNYKSLRHSFKQSGANEIVNMICKKFRQTEGETEIYRLGADEFIIIFIGAEKGETFTKIDNIRRSVAAAEFYISGRKKPLKLTLSCSVADKKRSDINALDVFARARKVLQRTYKFTQNITSQA